MFYDYFSTWITWDSKNPKNTWFEKNGGDDEEFSTLVKYTG